MSPKGGIKPHKRFSVQATRSEVLFVDYIAEHLTPTGRAAIIVPEGIIFQSGTAYKQLREMLVKKYLVAVISLPAGVFNPYSGVKTSIIILDRRLSQKTDSILFAKIENDGFGLGAQRRSIDKNDLPAAAHNIKAWMDSLQSEGSFDLSAANNLTLVEKVIINGNGEYNLSGDRYRQKDAKKSVFDLMPFQSVCTLEYGSSLPQDKRIEGPYPVLGSNGITGHHNEFLVEGPTIIVGRKGSAGEVVYVSENCFPIDTTYYVKRVNPENCDIKYLYYVLKELNLPNLKGGAGIPGLNRNDVYEAIQIPIPPLDAQKEIVAEIESYQKIIDGARQVVENYQSRIHVESDWPVVKFEDAPFQIIDGDRGANYPSKEDFSPSGHCLFLNTKNVRSDGFRFNEDDLEFISEEKDNALRKGRLERGDVLLTTRGTIGNTAFYGDAVKFDRIRINSGMLIFRPDANKLSGRYLFHFFQSENFRAQREAIVSGAAQPQLPIRSLNDAIIPLPPFETQNIIVADIENELRLVDDNKQLVKLFEGKVKAAINRVWDEAK